MNNNIFDENELQKFIHATKIGGLRSDATQNAFELLESAGEDEILQKYDSLSQAAQKRFRNAARNSVKDYETDDTSYNLGYFNEFIKE